MLKGKKVLLGICGGISAYKTPEVVRLLQKKGATVKVILTETGSKLVAPYALQTLTGNRVYSDVFCSAEDFEIEHIALARWADVFLIAPATANTIAKLSCGIADNLITLTAVSSKVPLVICPAMNSAIWENPLTQENVNKLFTIGCHFVGPEDGELACGETGRGRMSEPSQIVDFLEYLFTPPLLAGRSITITAGPTREAIDEVRFISNKSSGKMGFALAKWARNFKAQVKLISGPVAIPAPGNIEFVPVESALEMGKSINRSLSDIYIMCAAVCDIVPERHPGKLDKRKLKGSLVINRSPDLTLLLRKKRKKAFIVGFAAEYGLNRERARSKLTEKGLNLIVLNDISGSDTGFNCDTNSVVIIDKKGREFVIPTASKEEVARKILEFISKQCG